MTLTLYVRDPDLNRIGMIDEFSKITATPKFNDVGTWELELDQRIPLASALMQPRYGIELVHDGVQIMSGPVDKRRIERSMAGRKVTLTGWSDNVWLNRRIAHMEPATAAPPYATDAHDSRSGAASQVIREYVDANLGPAALPPRRVPGLTIRSDPAMGSNISGEARLQNLLEFIRGLAVSGGGLGFGIYQAGNHLEFQMWQPADLSATVKFSEALGNLGGFTYEDKAPVANYIFCGGGEELTDRVFVEGSDAESVAEWGRFEEFRDRRDTTDTTEMQQTITEELADKGPQTSLSISPFDTDTQRFGVNYYLGDTVTVLVEGEPIVNAVQSVTLTYDPDGPLSIKSEIGTPNRASILGIFRAVRDLGTRIRNLERR